MKKPRLLVYRMRERSAPSVRQCLVMLKAISMGEQQLQESDEDLIKLQQALKLTPLSAHKHTHEKTQAKTTKKPIAQGKPRRYPLRQEGETTDSFRSL